MPQKQNNYNNNFFKKHWKTLLVLVLITTISNSVTYALVKPDVQTDPGVAYRQKYPLLDGNRRLSQPENLITNIQPLREYLKSLPEQNKDWAEMSLYFEVMTTGANITVNPDLQIWPASLAKLPLAMVVMKHIESGKWTLDKMIQLTQEDADTLRTPDIVQDVGRSYDVKFLLERLLLESDNTAYRMLLKNFTNDELNTIGEAIGLEAFFSENGKVSAKDYSRLFRVLYLAAYLNEEHSQYLLRLMQDSEYKDFIRGGIPLEVPFAHKWGANLFVNVYADSGIVYIQNRPYMISIMVQSKLKDPAESQRRADALMKQVGQKTYEFISQQ